MSTPVPHLCKVAAAACLCLSALAARAADAAPEVVTVVAPKQAPAAYIPATTESVTAQQLAETINTVTTDGVLQYLPSTHVRERYIGDRNGILVMRVNSSIASAQTTVYADGLLLSNFLNNSFSTAPRWGMVSPEEIERIDTLYGPFSALYPGNSAGGVVRISTRMPTRFEAHVRLDAFTQRFGLYGTHQSYRYSGRQHNALFNTTTQQYNDPNPNVYGAVSHYSVFDGKVLYKLGSSLSLSLGVNNMGNFKYCVNPNPYPQRTGFAGLK